jgi:hypothetical protein
MTMSNIVAHPLLLGVSRRLFSTPLVWRKSNYRSSKRQSLRERLLAAETRASPRVATLHAGVRAPRSYAAMALVASWASRSQHADRETRISRNVPPSNFRRGGWWCNGQETPRSLSRVCALNASTVGSATGAVSTPTEYHANVSNRNTNLLD